MKKVTATTLLMVMAFSITGFFTVETGLAMGVIPTCEDMLNYCLDRADIAYWRCMRNGEESVCQRWLEMDVGRCYNRYYRCLYS